MASGASGGPPLGVLNLEAMIEARFRAQEARLEEALRRIAAPFDVLSLGAMIEARFREQDVVLQEVQRRLAAPREVFNLDAMIEARCRAEWTRLEEAMHRVAALEAVVFDGKESEPPSKRPRSGTGANSGGDRAAESERAAQASAETTPVPPLSEDAEQQVKETLEQIRLVVGDVEREAQRGHLRSARHWQDDLTKSACKLDALTVGNQTEARTLRRTLLLRIESASKVIEDRLAGEARVLKESVAAIDEVAANVVAAFDDTQASEYRGTLTQVAAHLDAIECASEAQRHQRRAQLLRIEQLEKELERRCRDGVGRT